MMDIILFRVNYGDHFGVHSWFYEDEAAARANYKCQTGFRTLDKIVCRKPETIQELVNMLNHTNYAKEIIELESDYGR